MKRLFSHAKKYRAECICGPLFKLLEASFELCVPLVIKRIIDIGICDGDKPYIVKMALLLVGLGLLGFVSSVTAQYFSAKAAVGTVAGLKSELLSHVQSLSHAELDKVGTELGVSITVLQEEMLKNGADDDAE